MFVDVITRTTDAVAPAWLNPGGGWSQTPPEGLREIEAWRFHAILTQAAPVLSVYRQHPVDGKTYASSVRWFVFDTDPNVAYGVAATGGTSHKFYMAGCEHNMVKDTNRSRMCYHVADCSKCGYHSEVDSSG